jgi:dTDP-4-dehydrorhamnose reductase
MHLAESAVLAFSRLNLVFRTGWLFGGDPRKPKNFVARRLEEANEALKIGRHELAANPLQRGNPTFTEEFADRLFEALERDESGVFNAVNSGSASRLEYVQAILEAAGLPLRAVPASADAGFKRVAQVSPNECALNWRFEALGYGQMPDWRHSLNCYIATLGALR